MTTDTKLKELVINKLTTGQYDSIEEKDPNQLYIVTDAHGFEESITNCLTHIPQDIKLELNNGTLTLKAGSKVYVPNGAGKFDVITISVDKIIQYGTVVSDLVMVIDVSNNSPTMTRVGLTSSGTSAPSSTEGRRFWYDTTNNLVKNYTSGSTNYNITSFPIAIIDCIEANKFTIKQVFNGFGYIGSTVFALPGVKGLIPNGRNEDGSLKNVEITTTKVVTTNTINNYNQAINLYVDSLLSVYGFEGIFNQTTPPTRAGGNLWYNPETNYWKYTENGGSTWNPVQLIPVAGAKTTTTVTSFTPKTTFHALDYNDRPTITYWGD